MNRKLSIVLLAIATILVGCNKYGDLIQDLNGRIEILEGNSIPYIEEQIIKINASLNDLISVDAAIEEMIANLNDEAAGLQQQIDDNASADAATKKALEERLAAITALIKELQDRDAAFDRQLAELKSYVDSKMDSAKDWAEATFATLEQYAALQTEVSRLSALIETFRAELEDGYTSAVEKAVTDMLAAITASENEMKGWVNETLAGGYYDIAAVDGKLSALEARLEDADEDLAQEIEDQKTALEAAKVSLKTAYEAAIATAIEQNNGNITTKIADAVKAANEDLAGKISAITTKVETIERLVNNLVDKVNRLETRIQSIRFIPEFADGKVEFTYENAPVALDFMVSPKEAAVAVAESFIADNTAVSACISRTQARTRSVDSPYDLLVTDVAGTSSGMLTVTVDPSILSSDYWANTTSANIFICINDGNNNIISEMIPAFYTPPTCYVWTSGIEASTSVKGKGIESAPYLIESANDLQWMIERVNDYNQQGSYYRLIHDLEIDSQEGAPWIPIGTESKPFVGYFDGGGNTISGEMVVANDLRYCMVGFFGNVGLGSIISNLTNEADVTSLIDGADHVLIGGIAGYVKGYEEPNMWGNGSYIIACHNKGNITAGSNVDYSCTGGIAGQMSGGTAIFACSNSGTLTDENESSNIGIFVGYHYLEYNCYKSCIVSCLYADIDDMYITNGDYVHERGNYSFTDAFDPDMIDNANMWIGYFNSWNYDYQNRMVVCDKHWEYENGSFVLKEGGAEIKPI